MQGTYVRIVGGRWETTSRGDLVCVEPGRVIYRSDWPMDAHAEIARMRRALQTIADGIAAPADVAQEALNGI